MAGKKNSGWQIEDWDDALDAGNTPQQKERISTGPENSWNQPDDEWDLPEDRDRPAASGKKNRLQFSSKTAIILGGVAIFAVILCIVLFTGPKAVNPVPESKTEGPLSGKETRITVPPVKQTEPPVTAPPATAVPVTKVPVTDAPPTATPSPSPSPTPLPAVQNDWYSEEMRYYYPQLTAKEKVCYALLYNGIMNFQKTINIEQAGCTIDEVKRVWFVICNDSPELFQLGSRYFYSSNRSSTIIDFSPSYRLNRTEYDTRSRHIRMRFDQIKGLFPADAGDYEKEFTIAKNIIQNCHYLIAKDKSTVLADACLYSGYAQCSGYTKGFNLLMRMAGIPCIEVKALPEEDHEWNIAKINGEWYNVDVTWDDGTEENEKQYQRTFPSGENEKLMYFNIPTRLFTKHHPDLNAIPFRLPPCTAIKDNYVYREGIYIPKGTANPAQVINERIEKGLRSGKTRFMIMMDDDIDFSQVQSQVSIPDSYYSIWPVNEETHCFYIMKTD